MSAKAKRRIKAAIAFWVAAILLAATGVMLWLGTKQASLQLLFPQETTVLCESKDAEAGVRAWMETYLEQYCQDYVWATSRLDSYTIDGVEVKGKKRSPTAVIDFTIQPTVPYSDDFLYWGVVQGSGIECEWTVRFKVDKEDGGYRFSYREREGEVPYDPAAPEDGPCVYTIADGKVKVSYNAGQSFTSLPVPLRELTRTWDEGGVRGGGLVRGSYLLTHQKTAFVYGGGEGVPLQILYSDDEGKSWQTAEVDGLSMTTRTRHCAFPSQKMGYVVASGNRTDRRETTRIYKTTDGGKSWTPVGEGPETGLLYGVSFPAADLGFFSYAPTFFEDGGVDTGLYRTTDGGKSFTQMKLPLPPAPAGWAQSDWQNVFLLPSAPLLEEGQLVCYLGQGERGTYKDGIVAAKYISTNNGDSWLYMGEEVPAAEIQFVL